MRRKKLTRGKSRRSFSKGTKVKSRNNATAMRGGYRI